MRYISSQTERAVRFVGLSTALANAGYVYAFIISLNLQNALACSVRSNFHAYSINLEKFSEFKVIMCYYYQFKILIFLLELLLLGLNTFLVPVV